jgi:hypothetical protein
MSFENDLIRFAKLLEERQDRALDLWSWLPSCEAAQGCLGDYHHELMPEMATIMGEACCYIGDLKAGRPMENEIYGCPCQGNCIKVNDIGNVTNCDVAENGSPDNTED